MDTGIGPEQDPSVAAFFDVDNTLMAGASMYHFAKGMAARKFFSWRDLVSFSIRQTKFKVVGERPEDLEATRESALAFIAGKRVADFVGLGEEIFDEEISDQIWPGTQAIAQAHVDAGHRVWLVTATPVELAKIIADRLDLTGALGTVAESVDGVYTGRLVGQPLHGEEKALAVRALAQREQLDLARCHAYSDSINDVPLLSMVGRAVAINPDAALRAEAKRRGWEIYDFRVARKAARIGGVTAISVGALGGGVAAGFAIRRNRAA